MFIGNPRVRKVMNACIDNFFYVLLYIVLPFVLGGTFIVCMYCRLKMKVRDWQRRRRNNSIKVGDIVKFRSADMTILLLRMSGVAYSTNPEDYDDNKTEAKGMVTSVTKIKGVPVSYGIDDETGFHCSMVKPDDIIRKI